MRHSISRGALYEKVWAEPISHAATKFGVSDVALAKAYRRHGIPVPHRGWWAKKQAGKSVARIPLPKPKAGMPDTVTVGRNPTWREQMEERARREPPPPPLPQDILDLAADARRQLGTIVVPKTLGRVHALLVPLLERDKRLKLAMRSAGYTPYCDRPLFADRFERRRLRVLNTLFRALERLGHRPALDGLDARELHVRVGEQHVKFTLDVPRDRRRRSTGKQGHECPLSLEIPMSRQVASQQTDWEDAKDRPLEAQIVEIVAGLVVAAEIQRRLDMAAMEEWERQRREEEERRERDRQDKIEQAKRDALLRAAIDWRHARYIREYVAAVQAATAGETEQRPTPSTARTEWVSWALAEADRLDTTKSYEANAERSNCGAVTP